MSVAVAITGIGVVSRFGVGTAPFWQGLLAGDGPASPPARVPELDVRRFARSAPGRRIDRASLLALAAARIALADAEVADDHWARARTSVALGSAFANLGETVGFLDRLLDRGTGNPLVFPNLVMNAPLSYATIELNAMGPSAMLTEQEASGEAAIAWGTRLVADGGADVCLAGGLDELEAVVQQMRAETGTMTTARARPFDRAAAGPCLGEGGAVLVLEPLAAAQARGARIYARLVPVAGFAVPAPVHGWPRDARALAERLEPLCADVDLVVAAANGTPALDAVEGAALATALGGRPVPITAPRGATGDFGAAGALAVAAAALAVAGAVVPPTAGCESPARDDLAIVVGAPRAATIRAVLVDGLARGGTCHPVRLEAP